MRRFFPSRAHKRPLRRRTVLGLLLLLLLLSCVSALLLNQRAAAASGMPGTVCLALETNPRIRLGIVWTSPILSSIPPLMLAPMKICVDFPSSPTSGAMPWWPRELLLIP